MAEKEKRKFKRLPLQYDLTCRCVESGNRIIYSGKSVDVSTGGIFFQTQFLQLELGNLLEIELKIPPTEGLLEFGGRLAGFAKIVRKTDFGYKPVKNHGIAAEFFQPLRLRS